MGNIFNFLITQPMGYIIEWIYNFIPNYGVAIILFTIVIKAIILPLTLKSQKSMAKQQKLQPLMAELQKKYANDKEKLNKEIMAMYKENGVNPASGCLPLLLQFPIIIGLYQVISKPLSYVLNFNFNNPEVIERVTQLQEAMKNITPDNSIWHTQTMADLAKNYQIAISKAAASLEGFSDFVLNFNFLGLDLSVNPSEGIKLFSGEVLPLSAALTLLIPIFAGLTSFLLTKMTPQATPAASSDDNSAANTSAQMGKSMVLMMPIMSLFFTFSMPAGVGLYWSVSNIIQMIQQYVLTKHFNQKDGDIIVVPVEKDRKKRKKR
mgnify:CR=1 FL=1